MLGTRHKKNVGTPYWYTSNGSAIIYSGSRFIKLNHPPTWPLPSSSTLAHNLLFIQFSTVPDANKAKGRKDLRAPAEGHVLSLR